MTIWLLTAIMLVPPLSVAIFVAMHADCNNRVVAIQLSTGFTVLGLATMSFAFDQPSFSDLVLGLALLSVPGTYLSSLFMERWL